MPCQITSGANCCSATANHVRAVASCTSRTVAASSAGAVAVAGRAGPSPSAARVGVSGVIGSGLMAVRDQGGAHQLAGSKSAARIASCSGGGREASPCGTRCRVSCRCRSARGDRGQERSGGFPTPVAPRSRRAGGIKKARGRGSLRRGLSREGASGAGR